MRRFPLLFLLAAALVAGCSLAPSDDVIRELVKSERSWCMTVNTVYGTARIAGTGIRNGTVSCSQEGMVVKSEDASGLPSTR
jgi:putative VirB-like lipoprotein